MRELEAGAIERAVRADLARLGELGGIAPSLAELAYRLAQSLDSSERLEGRELAPVAAQLRATLEAIAESVGEPDDPAISGLGVAVSGIRLPPPLGHSSAN